MGSGKPDNWCELRKSWEVRKPARFWGCCIPFLGCCMSWLNLDKNNLADLSIISCLWKPGNLLGRVPKMNHIEWYYYMPSDDSIVNPSGGFFCLRFFKGQCRIWTFRWEKEKFKSWIKTSSSLNQKVKIGLCHKG